MEFEVGHSDVENDFTIGSKTEPLVIGLSASLPPSDLPFDHHNFLTAPLASVKRKLEETESFESNYLSPPRKKHFSVAGFPYRLSTPLNSHTSHKKAKIEHTPNTRVTFSASLNPLTEYEQTAPSGNSSPLRIPDLIQDDCVREQLTVACRVCPFSTFREALQSLEEAGGVKFDMKDTINASVSLVFGSVINLSLGTDDFDLPLLEAIKNKSWHEGHIRDITLLQPDYRVDFSSDRREIITQMGTLMQWTPPKQLLDYAMRRDALGAIHVFFAQHGWNLNFEHELPQILSDVLVKRRRDLFKAIFEGLLDAGCDIFARWDPPDLLDHAWEEFLNTVGWEASSEFRWLISLGVLHSKSVPVGRRDLVELVRARRTAVLIRLGYPKYAANIITEY